MCSSLPFLGLLIELLSSFVSELKKKNKYPTEIVQSISFVLLAHSASPVNLTHLVWLYKEVLFTFGVFLLTRNDIDCASFILSKKRQVVVFRAVLLLLLFLIWRLPFKSATSPRAHLKSQKGTLEVSWNSPGRRARKRKNNSTSNPVRHLVFIFIWPPYRVGRDVTNGVQALVFRAAGDDGHRLLESLLISVVISVAPCCATGDNDATKSEKSPFTRLRLKINDNRPTRPLSRNVQTTNCNGHYVDRSSWFSQRWQHRKTCTFLSIVLGCKSSFGVEWRAEKSKFVFTFLVFF